MVSSRDALGGELGLSDLGDTSLDAALELSALGRELLKLGLGVGHELALLFVVVDGALLVVCNVVDVDGRLGCDDALVHVREFLVERVKLIVLLLILVLELRQLLLGEAQVLAEQNALVDGNLLHLATLDVELDLVLVQLLLGVQPVRALLGDVRVFICLLHLALHLPLHRRVADGVGVKRVPALEALGKHIHHAVGVNVRDGAAALSHAPAAHAAERRQRRPLDDIQRNVRRLHRADAR